MKRILSIKKTLALYPVFSALLFASRGVLVVLLPNPGLVSSDSGNDYRWEPSSAVGNTWATSWFETQSFTSSASAWTGSAWSQPQTLRVPATNGSVFDVYLAWDAPRNRFVFVGIDNIFSDVQFGYSDATGTSWTFRTQPVLQNNSRIVWDYPSIAIDSGGRILIAAVAIRRPVPGDPGGPDGLFTALSTDGGISFAGGRVGNTCTDNCGSESRVIAAGSVFHAFLADYTATTFAADHYESTDGFNWTSPVTFGPFLLPKNNSTGNAYCGPNGCANLFFAPLLDARGSANGFWSAVWQVNYQGFNNVVICTSAFGCGFVLPVAEDQFLAGTSVNTDGAYWISFYTYSTQAGRLRLNAIYYPPNWPNSGPEIGAYTNDGIDPASWRLLAADSISKFRSRSAYDRERSEF